MHNHFITSASGVVHLIILAVVLAVQCAPTQLRRKECLNVCVCRSCVLLSSRNGDCNEVIMGWEHIFVDYQSGLVHWINFYVLYGLISQYYV